MTTKTRTAKPVLPFPTQPWLDPVVVGLARNAPARTFIEGTLIAAFEVPGAAVPWRAPTRGKFVSYTPAHVVAWKELVAKTAHDLGLGEGAGQAPYPGFVELVLWFYRKAPKKKLIGTRWGSVPDWDNLAKGMADSVSGNVFKKSIVETDPETGQVVRRPDGKPKKVPTRFLPPSPTGRIIANDKFVTDATVHKVYAGRSLAYVAVYAADPVNPGPFPVPL